MKKITILFLIHSTMPLWCNNFKILNDTPELDRVGLGICNADENGEFDLINNCLKPNRVVFDLGANKGSWTQFVLQTQPSSIVYAFEPIPDTFKSLQSNIKNQNVHVFNMAVDKEVGSKEFYIYADSRGATDWSSFYFRPEIAYAKQKVISVPTINLDQFCKQHGISHIDFLKIDTEGAELSVLLGAQELLQNKAIPLIQFEYGGTYRDANITLEQVFELLSLYGYTIYRIIPNGLIRINRWRAALENYTYSNYVAILTNFS